MSYSAEKINEFIDNFKNIDTNEPPKDEKVTVFCDDGNDEVGFCENTLFSDIGFNMFIAKKWILQTELDELMKD